MRRIKLVWFALGVGTSLSLLLASSLILQPRESGIAFLQIIEPAENDFRALVVSGELRRCGVKEFTVGGAIPDGEQVAFVPLNDRNAEALACVSKLLITDKYQFEVKVGDFDQATRFVVG